jgi:hypothetical protein
LILDIDLSKLSVTRRDHQDAASVDGNNFIFVTVNLFLFF